MFNWDKVFSRRNWQNKPSQNTPLSANNLNASDYAVNELDNRVIELDTSKLDITTANTMVKDVSFDEATGIFTVTRLNGTTFIIDTKLEKIAVNFRFDKERQVLIIILDDGEEQVIDLSALITQYEFLDSDTIGFQVQSDGKIKAIVIDGSITENKLQPNFLADIKVQAKSAESSANSAASSADAAAYDAKLSQSYAVGGSGIRDGEDTDNAKYYKEQASESENNASQSATQASNSANAAAASEANAKASETNAAASAESAASSANAAMNSANAAADSEERALDSANEAALSAESASVSATNAKASEVNAKSSEKASKTSETNAANSANVASIKAQSATDSAESASDSATTATSKANEASISAENASNSETNAKTYADNASNSASSASNSATTATSKANAATTSAENASTSASNAAASATKAQNYATGSADSAKYYYEQSKAISESFSGSLRPMGTVAFANLPELSSVTAGDMYNVSDEFVTTSDFAEGVGFTEPAGSNVYKTVAGKWDILAGTPVTGVKGANETTFRRGNVNITKDNIGLGNVPNVTTNNQTPSYTVSTTLTDLKSGEILSVAFGKVAKAVTDLMSHLADTVKHIAQDERTRWNDAVDNVEAHTEQLSALQNTGVITDTTDWLSIPSGHYLVQCDNPISADYNGPVGGYQWGNAFVIKNTINNHNSGFILFIENNAHPKIWYRDYWDSWRDWESATPQSYTDRADLTMTNDVVNTYTSESNAYEFRSDGYLMLRGPCYTGILRADIISANGVKFYVQMCGATGKANGEYNTIYLRKGFKVYFKQVNIPSDEKVEAYIYLLK